MNDVLNEQSDIGVPGRAIEFDGVQIDVQVRETANLPLHADYGHQVGDQ